MTEPRLSILIPNYNNGRESSRDGRRDFLGDLFRSLLETLVDDPTPLEIIVADDGSSDDSVETCRTWAQRQWPAGPRAGRPFCRLITGPHCGVLSVVANRLTEEARGELCCRLDGDIVVHTPRWVEHLCRVFDHGPPDLGVVGPLQLGTDGRIHSAGCWILHPRGHHHIARGADPALVTRALEVDHVMGCFYVHRRRIWGQLGGYDESFLRGQTVDFGIAARREGWRTWCVPAIRFTHYHSERRPRPTTADSVTGVEAALTRFQSKWGFDRLAPDLDEVARRYRGTGLLWNARVFGPSAPWPVPAGGPVDIRQSEWGRYAGDERFRAAVDQRLEVVQHACEHLDDQPRVLMVRSRAGLLCHRLAEQGLVVVGVESDPHLVELARQVVRSREYGSRPPRYTAQRDPRCLPVEDASADLVLLFDVLETHGNPVGLLREAHRVLAPGGLVAMLTRQRMSLHDADYDALHAYTPEELVLQVQATRLFEPMADPAVARTPGAMVLFGRRREADDRSFYPASSVRAEAPSESVPAAG